MKRQLRRFSEEFKSDAVKLVLESGVTGERAAKDLGIGYSTLQNWIAKYRATQKVEAPEALLETDEVRRLKTEINKLKLERDLLKKATVFFANDRTS